jgi:acyl dehydratase
MEALAEAAIGAGSGAFSLHPAPSDGSAHSAAAIDAFLASIYPFAPRMSLNLSAVGKSTAPLAFTYDWKTLALYALGIGAKRDELDYLYEGRGPKVYPTFAVVPALAAVGECLGKTGGNMAMVVHGSQSIVAHRSLPPSGTILTTGVITGIYDMKKLAQVVIATSSTVNGEKVYDTEWSILFRGAGGFDGAPPPKREDVPVPKDRPADFRFEEATAPEQALLYRLSGDLNPLHADPEFATAVGFPQGPILHGLATYGFAARAVVKGALGGDASKLIRIDAQFRKPVWPGDTLVTEGWRLDGGKIALATSVKERAEQVLTSAHAVTI